MSFRRLDDRPRSLLELPLLLLLSLSELVELWRFFRLSRSLLCLRLRWRSRERLRLGMVKRFAGFFSLLKVFLIVFAL